jgi:hypothetical protein
VIKVRDSEHQRAYGAITVNIRWLHYGDHGLVPLRRSRSGAITANMEWLHKGDH